MCVIQLYFSAILCNPSILFLFVCRKYENDDEECPNEEEEEEEGAEEGAGGGGGSSTSADTPTRLKTRSGEELERVGSWGCMQFVRCMQFVQTALCATAPFVHTV